MGNDSGSTKAGFQGQPRLMAFIETVGDVLLLQLLFVLVSLPLVTVVPAAVALQYTLADVLDGGAGPASAFWRAFRRAAVRTWKPALLLPILSIAAVASLLFWQAAEGLPRLAALTVLFPLYGALMASYIAALATLSSIKRSGAALDSALDAGLRDWWPRIWTIAQERALRLAVSVAAMALWFLALLNLPTLALLGTGLVPAALAWWVGSPRRRGVNGSDDQRPAS